VSTLDSSYDKSEINDLANLAFISAKANRKIGGQSPRAYFPSLGEDELAAHCVPCDLQLREPSEYPRFLAARRRLLAGEMSRLLDRFRPDWLDAAPTADPDPAAGWALDLALYESQWENGRLVFTGTGPGLSWNGEANMAELESAIDAAGIVGLDGDVEIAGVQVPVRLLEGAVEIEIGPFLVSGTPAEWRQVLDRERGTARPLSDCPSIEAVPWAGDRRPFPITSTH
jgi:hypothetical protein